MADSAVYYHRHLPHYQPEGERYHVVFRLAGSIPASVLEELRFQGAEHDRRIQAARDEEEKLSLIRHEQWKYFERFEKLFDTTTSGPLWLRKPEVAAVVDEAIHYRDGKEYDLIAHTIMPNHVHMVFTLLPENLSEEPVRRTDCPTYKEDRVSVLAPYFQYRLSNIMRRLKWNTALRANRVLHRHGAFWHDESYDHVIRDDDELDRTVEYVLMNPIKARMCKDWREWPWTYVKPGSIGD